MKTLIVASSIAAALAIATTAFRQPNWLNYTLWCLFRIYKGARIKCHIYSWYTAIINVLCTLNNIPKRV